jgi:hypothetical protein
VLITSVSKWYFEIVRVIGLIYPSLTFKIKFRVFNEEESLVEHIRTTREIKRD